MKRMFLIALLALGGCSAINVATKPVDAVSLQKAAFAAKATYVAGLVVAAQIVVMPRCEKAPAPCVPQAVVDQIRKADVAADTATQAGEDGVRNLSGNPTLLSLTVDNATSAANVFKAIVETYKGK